MLKIDMITNLLKLNEDDQKLLNEYYELKNLIKVRNKIIEVYKKRLKKIEESLVFCLIERESDDE